MKRLAYLSLVFFSFIVVFYSCNKESDKLVQNNSINQRQSDLSSRDSIKLVDSSLLYLIKDFKFDDKVKLQVLHYKGLVYKGYPKIDIEKNTLSYDNLPDGFKTFGENNVNNTITHVFIYEDREEIFLFDDSSEYKEAIQFEKVEQNELKQRGFAQAICYTTEHVNSWPNQLFSYSDNRTWKKFNYNNVGPCYGESYAWVGPNYNDKMSLVQMSSSNNEKVQFMGCVNSNWGDPLFGMGKVYITLMTSNSHRYGSGNLHTYPRGIGWFGISHWGDQISSFEFYQTNNLGFIGQQI
ncbi:MAG: hypothetical protein MUE53_05985 [Chitinophagales bacterium]|jgi:hypothetical protein|nr:hypothetical protein [Chitinophagales bacterium]